MRAKFLTLILLISCTALFGQKKLLKEATEFGQRLEQAYIEDDSQFLNNLFDKDAFTDRIIIKRNNPEFRRFNEGFLSGFDEMLSFYNLLFKNMMAQGDEFTFVRAHVKDKTAHVLFRVYGEGGLNYHDYELSKNKSGFQVVDMYLYLSGENMSKTIQRVYLMGAKGAVGQLGDEDVGEMDMESIMALQGVRNLITAGRFEEANEAMAALGEDILKEKVFALIDIQIKGNLDEDIYLEALTNYRNNFPDDPSQYLIAIDFLILQERFDESLANLDKLDENLGGDPFLNFYRGNISYMQGNLEQAQMYLEKVTQEVPDLLDAFDSLLSTYIDLKKNKEAVGILEKFVNSFDIGKEVLIEVMEAEPSYKAFVDTEEYKAWKAG